MLFTKRNEPTQDDDPYTPISPRARSRAARKSGSPNSSRPTTYLRPPTASSSRNRSTSSPTTMVGRANDLYAKSRIPKPANESPKKRQSVRLPPISASFRPVGGLGVIVSSPSEMTLEEYYPPQADSVSRFPASVSTSYCDSLRRNPRMLVKPDPTVLMCHLSQYLGPDIRCLQHLLHLDDLIALHEREWMERAERGAKRKNSAGDMTNVFGTPLRQVSAYASTTAILGGLEHELPIVVFASIEELYRALKSPSTTAYPCTGRLPVLMTTFDTPPHFGCTTSLFRESESDIYALLRTFTASLPEPIIYPDCISRSLVPFTLDAPDVRALQIILRFLPSPHLSLFVYLLAFFSQVTETKPGTEFDLGRDFGSAVFGHANGPAMLVWFIKNWSGVVRGLFELDCDLVGLRTSTSAMLAPNWQDKLSLRLPSPYDPHEQKAGDSTPRIAVEIPEDDAFGSPDLFAESAHTIGVSLLLEEELDSLAADFLASPPHLRVVNGSPSSSVTSSAYSSAVNSPASFDNNRSLNALLDFPSDATHILDLEKKMKISETLKKVPSLQKDSDSVYSWRGVIVAEPSDCEFSCSSDCSLRAKVEMTETHLWVVRRERDEARELIEKIKRIIAS